MTETELERAKRYLREWANLWSDIEEWIYHEGYWTEGEALYQTTREILGCEE